MAKTGEDSTRQRLLDAAGEAFALKGFRDTPVREICRKARANVAAVNYHFGNKQRLYTAVLEYMFEQAVRTYPPDMGVGEGASAGDRLRAFVHSLLLRSLGSGRPTWLGKLLAREIADPTPALDELFAHSLGPLYVRLGEIVAELAGPATRRRINHATASVVAQCLFYYNVRSVVARFDPGQRYDRRSLAELADHITTFSLAGLGAIGKR